MHSHGEAKFWLEPIIELAQNFGLSSKELREAENLLRAHEQEIRNAWSRHFTG
ncbi:DUF4160 domain-containing protein [Methylocaldum sp.]|uniref:DUF4160 domain-containing protein n=1 Tax=Methylocaldum sp. TaxID=1969727 RepID=UPI0039C8D261